MKNNSLCQLADYGQSFWMDTISRPMIQDGTLRKMIKEDGLRGVTSNPDIFQKAISGSNLYDAQIRKLALAGKNAVEIYEGLAVEDIRKAADILRPVYDATKGLDGYISLEVSPYLAFDTQATIEEAHRLWAAVDKKNVLIKVPATPEGIPVIRQLIADGISVNVTLIFSRQAYKDVMNAYLSGLEDRRKAGKSVRDIASVASFFISRIDVLVDKLLSARTDKRAHALLGKVAIACGKMAYQDYKQVFGGKRWQALKKAGAKVQRPLWASTSSKNPLYDDLVYVAPFIGKDTVNTMPMNTIDAWRAQGKATANSIEEGLDEAKRVLRELEAVGVDIDAVTWQLVEEGVGKFNVPFDKLLSSVSEKRLAILGWDKSQQEYLGKHEKALGFAMESMSEARFGRRLAAKDPALFSADKADYAKISNRLGWLNAPADMMKELDSVADLVRAARKEKVKHLVLLGMGGSSLCPEVCGNIFGSKQGFPELVVLDTTSPEAIAAATKKMDITKAWFIVASKSGGTVETMSLYQHFSAELAELGVSEPGKHFVAITDPNTSLGKLARSAGFRAVFINPPDIGGRYSALSLFGLVPMALIGIDVKKLLQRVLAFSADLATLVPVTADPAVRLGAIMGEMARAGRDKLTIIASEEYAPLGPWIEQLIAESTGKKGKGILPVVFEKTAALKTYGPDRLFVGIVKAGDTALESKLTELATAHPVVKITVSDVYDLGAEFFRWEVATAIAGAVLGINPFDEPNVSEAKDKTKSLLDDYQRKGKLPEPPVSLTDKSAKVSVSKSLARGGTKPRTIKQAVEALAKAADPSDYIALLAFIPATDAHRAYLNKVAVALRTKTGCPVTIGFGPRYLHSTGQLHKGGADNGLFVVIVDDTTKDIEIPGSDYSFGTLIRAQGIGDFLTLDDHGKRALLLDLGEAKLTSTSMV